MALGELGREQRLGTAGMVVLGTLVGPRLVADVVMGQGHAQHTLSPLGPRPTCGAQGGR